MEEALIKRILPHSIEAEQSVIGSMILDRDAILVASEILTSDDFYQKRSDLFEFFSTFGIYIILLENYRVYVIML